MLSKFRYPIGMEALADGPLAQPRSGDLHRRMRAVQNWLLAPAEEVGANVARRLQQALFGGPERSRQPQLTRLSCP